MACEEGEPLVLVVDDDPTIRLVVSEALADEGIPVVTADDGSEALRLVQVETPRLILLDMRMPVVDGWEFARRYRSLPGPKAPIVVVTAATDPAAWAEEIGADGVISKPFDVDELVGTVRRHVGAA